MFRLFQYRSARPNACSSRHRKRLFGQASSDEVAMDHEYLVAQTDGEALPCPRYPLWPSLVYRLGHVEVPRHAFRCQYSHHAVIFEDVFVLGENGGRLSCSILVFCHDFGYVEEVIAVAHIDRVASRNRLHIDMVSMPGPYTGELPRVDVVRAPERQRNPILDAELRPNTSANLSQQD